MCRGLDKIVPHIVLFVGASVAIATAGIITGARKSTMVKDIVRPYADALRAVTGDAPPLLAATAEVTGEDEAPVDVVGVVGEEEAAAPAKQGAPGAFAGMTGMLKRSPGAFTGLFKRTGAPTAPVAAPTAPELPGPGVETAPAAEPGAAEPGAAPASAAKAASSPGTWARFGKMLQRPPVDCSGVATADCKDLPKYEGKCVPNDVKMAKKKCLSDRADKMSKQPSDEDAGKACRDDYARLVADINAKEWAGDTEVSGLLEPIRTRCKALRKAGLVARADKMLSLDPAEAAAACKGDYLRLVAEMKAPEWDGDGDLQVNKVRSIDDACAPQYPARLAASKTALKASRNMGHIGQNIGNAGAIVAGKAGSATYAAAEKARYAAALAAEKIAASRFGKGLISAYRGIVSLAESTGRLANRAFDNIGKFLAAWPNLARLGELARQAAYGKDSSQVIVHFPDVPDDFVVVSKWLKDEAGLRLRQSIDLLAERQSTELAANRASGAVIPTHAMLYLHVMYDRSEFNGIVQKSLTTILERLKDVDSQKIDFDDLLKTEPPPVHETTTQKGSEESVTQYYERREKTRKEAAANYIELNMKYAKELLRYAENNMFYVQRRFQVADAIARVQRIRAKNRTEFESKFALDFKIERMLMAYYMSYGEVPEQMQKRRPPAAASASPPPAAAAAAEIAPPAAAAAPPAAPPATALAGGSTAGSALARDLRRLAADASRRAGDTLTSSSHRGALRAAASSRSLESMTREQLKRVRQVFDVLGQQGQQQQQLPTPASRAAASPSPAR